MSSMATSVRPDEYAGPVLVSVGIHVLVILAMAMNLTRCDDQLVLPQVPEHVKAVVIERKSRQPVVPERSVLKKVEIPEIVMPPAPEKPLDAVKPAPRAAEKGMARPEPVKPAAQAKPTLPPPPDFSDLLAQEEKHLAKREAVRRETDEQAAREASARASQNQKTVNEYTALIAAEVQRRWIKPPAIKPGLFAEFRIRLLPGGELLDVKLTRSSGDASFDSSAETAIRLAGRLPVPADSQLFNAAFRQFNFRFRPEDVKK